MRNERKRSQRAADMGDADHTDYYPSRGLSWKHWAMIVSGLALLGLGAIIVHFAWPVLALLGPVFGYAISGAVVFCIVAAPCVAVWWLIGERENRSLQHRRWDANEHNVFPVLVKKDQSGFHQANNGQLPTAVPQTLTLHQQNDGAMARMLEHLIKHQQQALPQTTVQEVSTPELPEYVEYTDKVRGLIPSGHALVGVTGQGVETKVDEIRALLWIVGGSGSGKTNSTVIRVDDDARKGHQFLGCDPHWVKDDSLTNALAGYAHLFLVPMARSLEEIEQTLDRFIEEFKGRKDQGWPCNPPITLLVDEVGSLTTDVDPNDEMEVRIARKLKSIARIAGQEARNFHMCAIYITQTAAGLAWLRKCATMVLAHQVLMMSERKLACNEDAEVARSMDNWPRGRTYAYGLCFQNGPMMVQQPVVKTRVVDAAPVMPELPRNALRNWPEQAAETHREEAKSPERAQELAGTDFEENFSSSFELKKILKRYSDGESINSILKSHGLAPGGRNNQNLKALLDGMNGTEGE